jgi:septum site-determining protein MinD
MQQRIAVVSGKGGVGKSTVSACLAQQMAARGHRVLLIDGDIGLRSLDLILGVDEHVLFTWADVALGRCTLKQAVMVFGKLHLLCAPLQHEHALEDGMLQGPVKSCAEYDVVLVDAPAGIGFGFRAAVLACSRCVIVTTADPICVRSVAAASKQATRLGCGDIRLLINRFDRRQVLRGEFLMIDDVIDLTETQLIGVVPQDTRLFARTANGAPLQESIVTKAVARVAARLDGENIPLDIPAAD